jgi:GxxExxY protein
MIAGHEALSKAVIGAAIEVHRALGPGLLEAAYAACLAEEFNSRQLPFRREIVVPLVYKGTRVEQAFRADFVVDERLLVEIKCVETLLAVHRAQTATYLRLLGLDRGLLINFHSHRLVDGVKSIVPGGAAVRDEQSSP